MFNLLVELPLYNYRPETALDEEPLEGPPLVGVLDEEGRTVAMGYYIFHRDAFPSGLQPAGFPHHLVAVGGFSDWGMPRMLQIYEVTPPHRLECVPQAAQ